jgi:uncharacterized membrane protein YjfL (UPF0719 family)
LDFLEVHELDEVAVQVHVAAVAFLPTEAGKFGTVVKNVEEKVVLVENFSWRTVAGVLLMVVFRLVHFLIEVQPDV